MATGAKLCEASHRTCKFATASCSARGSECYLFFIPPQHSHIRVCASFYSVSASTRFSALSRFSIDDRLVSRLCLHNINAVRIHIAYHGRRTVKDTNKLYLHTLKNWPQTPRWLFFIWLRSMQSFNAFLSYWYWKILRYSIWSILFLNFNRFRLWKIYY